MALIRTEFGLIHRTKDTEWLEKLERTWRLEAENYFFCEAIKRFDNKESNHDSDSMD